MISTQSSPKSTKKRESVSPKLVPEKNQGDKKAVQFDPKVPTKMFIQHSVKKPRKTILLESMPKELKNGVKPTTETTESIEESSTSIKTPLPEEEPAKKRQYFNPFSIGAK